MTSLAWSNLKHEKIRTAVAVAGVTFAVVLMFMQLGFLGGVERTSTVIYQALDFDILLRSPTYLHVSDARSFPMRRIRQAASLSGVESVVPFYIAINAYQNPRSLERWSILTMGVQPKTKPFQVEAIQQQVQRLTNHTAAIIDRKSQAKYGPVNGREFSDADVGVVTEIGQKEKKVVGTFELGTGLAANAAVILTDAGFARATPRRSTEQVSLGLIRIADDSTPAEIDAVAKQLRTLLKDQQDVVVLTRNEAIRAERRYWLFDKSIGIIFLMGVAVAFVVGLAIVFQVLSGDVSRHLGEYATLKAMGYQNSYLSGVVVKQAAILAVLGFFVGWLISVLLFAVTSKGAGIPIQMDPLMMIAVFIATFLMCISSGWAALRKAHRAQPADLF